MCIGLSLFAVFVKSGCWTGLHESFSYTLRKEASQKLGATGWFKHVAPNLFSIQRSRRFFKIYPEIWHACSMSTYPAIDDFFVFSLLSPDTYFQFFLENLGSASNVHAVFGRCTLKFDTRVLWAPTQPFTNVFFFFSFFWVFIYFVYMYFIGASLGWRWSPEPRRPTRRWRILRQYKRSHAGPLSGLVALGFACVRRRWDGFRSHGLGRVCVALFWRILCWHHGGSAAPLRHIFVLHLLVLFGFVVSFCLFFRFVWFDFVGTCWILLCRARVILRRSELYLAELGW